MAEFMTKCPHCKNDLQVEDEWIGMNVDCPICSKTFTVQKSPARRSKNNSRTSSTPKYYCSNCKKEYPEPVKFCSECGSAIKIKSSNGAKNSAEAYNSDDSSTFYTWFWTIAILIGVPVLLTIWIDWPRTIFWCTLPLWGICLGVIASEVDNKLAILLFAGITWWGWWAHTRVEIPTPEQTVKTEESKQMAKAKTPAQMVKITSQAPAATSAQAKQKTNTPTPAPAATSAQANNTSNIAEKKSPPLEFLGISVNESKENIEAHLRKRGFSPGKGPTYKEYDGEFLCGTFWILRGTTTFAHISFDSGRIKVIFDTISVQSSDASWKIIHAKYKSELQEGLQEYNSFIKQDNDLTRKYFAVLESKYGKAKNNLIELEDGLIEFNSRQKFCEGLTNYNSLTTYIPDDYCCVFFYNRQAAERRLQEIYTTGAKNLKKMMDI